MALLGEDYTLCLELDGAPSARTALVEVWVDWSAATLGANCHPSPNTRLNTRLQVNAAAHHVNGPAPAQGFDDARWVPILLPQLQFKF